jgi:hypothetical protein
MLRTNGYPERVPRWRGDEPIRYVAIAGIPVRVARLVELVRRLREVELNDTAEKLMSAWAREAHRVTLTATDRVALLEILLRPTEELAVLHGVLLRGERI